jgi:hypothetical protein
MVEVRQDITNQYRRMLPLGKRRLFNVLKTHL